MKRQWLSLFLGMLLAFQVNAMNVVSEDSGDGAMASLIDDSGYMELAPANSHGISYNKFSVFDLESEALHVLNVHTAVNLIVFEASDFILDAEIRLIGKSADILFISQDAGGDIYCQFCSFRSFPRVTLAVANVERGLSSLSSEIATLNAGIEGRISIHGIYAPDVLILESVSEQLAVSGKNTTNSKVSLSPNGGLIVDDQGNKTLGGGSLHLNIGDVDWNYEERQVTASVASSDLSTLSGFVDSPEVKITSSLQLIISASIDNTVDFLSSTQYQGQVFVPSASTVITSLSDEGVKISESINSPETLGVYSNGDVEVAGQLKAELIEIVAKENFLNTGALSANNVGVSARRTINRSKISAERLVKLHGVDFVGNEYGGDVSARTVRILSPSGLVRNGARTPYITTSSNVLNLISDHSPVLNPSGIEGGMYYATDHIQMAGKEKAVAISAMVSGNDIYIEAAAVENINPYWAPIQYVEQVSEDGEVVNQGQVFVNSAVGNGVAISAVHDLLIHGSDYVYNSSAIIETNSSEGLLEITGSILLNERYRRMNLLGKNDFEPGKLLLNGSEVNIDKSDDYSADFFTQAHVYSMPGRIFSSGKAKFTATSAVINNISFLEALGDVEIESATIRQIGHENRLYNKFRLYDENLRAQEGHSVVTHDNLDALFKVGGYLYADESSFVPENTDSLNEYLGLAAHEYVDGIYESVYGHTSDDLANHHINDSFDCYMTCEYYYIRSSEVVDDTDYDSFLQSTEMDASLNVHVLEVAEFGVYDEIYGWVGNESGEWDVYNDAVEILDILIEYYEKVKSEIVSKIELLWAELDWWS